MSKERSPLGLVGKLLQLPCCLFIFVCNAEQFRADDFSEIINLSREEKALFEFQEYPRAM